MYRNKQTVSLRLSRRDIEYAKGIAKRLKVKESKVLRFSLKHTLNRLSPLSDTTLNGVDLLPVIIDMGYELSHYFEMDSRSLYEIVNGNEMDQKKIIDKEDISLFAMQELLKPILMHKLNHTEKHIQPPNPELTLFRKYLYEKYLGEDRKPI